MDARANEQGGPQNGKGGHRAGPADLSALVTNLMGRRGLGGAHRTLDKVREAWMAHAGTELVDHTRVRSLQRGRLVIEVDSAARCHHLASFEKERLLIALQEKLPRVVLTELHFRVGAFE